METNFGDIRQSREEAYFLQQEQQLLEQMRRNVAREAETLRLMEALGIRQQEVVRELAEMGFDLETFRLLYLVPLIQAAWSDGGISEKEKEKLLEIAALHGFKAGSAEHDRLMAWLTERPSDRFFRACLHGVKAMLHSRPPEEARSMGRELVSYCTRIASASGGFFGLGSRISAEEEAMLAHLAQELEVHHHAGVGQLTKELARE